MRAPRQKSAAHLTRTISATLLALAFPVLSWGAPPSAGTILQQTQPPPELPTAPGPVIQLPAPKQQSSQSSMRFEIKRVELTGNTLIPTTTLTPLVENLQGHEVSLGELQQTATYITDFYHAHGYPLAYAYLPAQKIEDGIVTFAVVEPRYDRIDLKMDSRLHPDQARKTLGLKSGDPIEQSSLERGLLLLNQTPGIRVAGTLVPGATAGTSTLAAQVTDTPIVRGSLGADNYGSNYTGRVRGLVQAGIDNPFGYGAQISGNVLNTEGGLLHAEGINLLSPDIWAGVRLGVYGSHTTYTLGDEFAVLHERGKAKQMGVSLNAPLILAPGRLLEARLDVLRDRFKQSSSLIGLDDRSHLDIARLTFNGTVADSTGGVSSGGIVVTRGSKHIDSDGSRLADAAGPQTSGSFWTGQLQLQRAQPLPLQLQLQASLSGQISSQNLDGSEKFYLGGPQGVMSYTVGEGGGDQGVLARLGLFHAIPLPIPGQLSAGALLQGGEVWLNHSDYLGAATKNRQGLGGAGVELNYRWSTHVGLKFDYVHRLGNTPSGGDANQHNEIWASLQINS